MIRQHSFGFEPSEPRQESVPVPGPEENPRAVRLNRTEMADLIDLAQALRKTSQTRTGT